MSNQTISSSTKIVQYSSGGISLDARIEDGQAWLTYEQAAELFGRDVNTIKEHAQSIWASSECSQETTRRNLRLVRLEGHRLVSRDIVHLSQDMVLHIGYAVRSDRGSEFRRWATHVLKGEAAPLAPAAARTMTQAELIAASANMLVEIERKQLEQEQRISTTESGLAALEAAKAQSEAEAKELGLLPPASAEAPPETEGELTVAAIRAWGFAHAGAYQAAYRMLYQAVLLRATRIDLRARLKSSRGKRLADVIDATGKAGEIYAIARELFCQNR